MLRTRFVTVAASRARWSTPTRRSSSRSSLSPAQRTDEERRLQDAVRERAARPFDLAAATPMRWTLFELAGGRHALLRRLASHPRRRAFGDACCNKDLADAYAAARAGRRSRAARRCRSTMPTTRSGRRKEQGGATRRGCWPCGRRGLPTCRCSRCRPIFAARRRRASAADGRDDRPPARGGGGSPKAHRPRGRRDAVRRVPRRVRRAAVAPVGRRGFRDRNAGCRPPRAGARRSRSASSPTRSCCAPTCPAHRRRRNCCAGCASGFGGDASTSTLPFATLVDALGAPRDPSRNPLFQVAFAMREQRPGRSSARGRAKCAAVRTSLEQAKFDLTLVARRVGATASTRTGTTARTSSCTRRSSGWPASTRRWSRRWRAHPTRPVATLPLMDDATAGRIVSAAQGPGTALSAPTTTIPERFAEQARATPGARAIEALDYAGLEAAANRLAQELRAQGVAAGAVVAVARRRSADIAVAWLAVLKAGAAYLPIDPDAPPERIAFMLADAKRGPRHRRRRARDDVRPIRRLRHTTRARCGAHRRPCHRRRRRDAGRRAPGRSGLRDLHVGVDRNAEGRGGSRIARCCVWSAAPTARSSAPTTRSRRSRIRRSTRRRSSSGARS